MINIPWWVAAIAIGIVLFLIVKVARLSDKLRTLRKIICRLEGIEEEEVEDTECGDVEGHG